MNVEVVDRRRVGSSILGTLGIMEFTGLLSTMSSVVEVTHLVSKVMVKLS